MNKAILCIGIDAFKKNDIEPLQGAASDARRWAAFFEHRLGFVARTLTHEDLRAGARVFDLVDELLDIAGQPGDQFGVFIATHGKQVALSGGGHDQVFLLPDARLASIEAGSAGEGTLSLRQLALETARQGLRRFFIIDACRAPLRQPPAGAPRDAREFAAEGQVVYRDPRIVQARNPQVHSPLLILNACADGQRAGELRDKRRGLFSMAAEEMAVQRLGAGVALTLNAEFAATVGARMRQLAHQHDDDAVVQDPVIDQGEALNLWAPRHSAAAAPAPMPPPHKPAEPPAAAGPSSRVPELLGRFEQQMQAGRLASPPWDCCAGTLALLHDAGLPELMLGLLQQKLEQAAAPPKPQPPRPAERLPLAQMPAGHEFRDADWAPRMVVIPPGRFVMGSPPKEEGGSDDERPQREVQITQAFAMGRCVVTFDDYDRFAKDAGVALPSDAGWGRGNRPAIHVSWDDAQAYIAWLNAQLRLVPAQGYRLPTESEWEYAARAGTTTAFWWGDQISAAQANYDGRFGYGSRGEGEYLQRTVEADAFEANPWGLYNVHGNVREWVQDCSHYSYQGAPTTQRAREESNDKRRRVVRGGSWIDTPRDLRSARRDQDAPDYRLGFVGFRLARTL